MPSRTVHTAQKAGFPSFLWLNNIVKCKNQYQIPKTKASEKDFGGSRKVIGNLDKQRGFPDSSVGKESACNTGDPSSIPGSGVSAGEGIGYPLQYSWLSLMAQLVKNPPTMRDT